MMKGLCVQRQGAAPGESDIFSRDDGQQCKKQSGVKRQRKLLCAQDDEAIGQQRVDRDRLRCIETEKMLEDVLKPERR